MKRPISLPKDKLLPRLSLKFFGHPRIAAGLWILLVVFGALSYGIFLKREGFPSISIPIVVVNGSYAVNNPEQVDVSVGKVVSDIAKNQQGFKTVETRSQANFFTATIEYKEGTNAEAARSNLEKAVTSDKRIPKGAALSFVAPYFGATGGSIEKIDAAISVYDRKGTASTPELSNRAKAVVAYLNAHKPSEVTQFFIENPYVETVNPTTGKPVAIQRTFDRYGERQNGRTTFYDSVSIGATKVKGADVIKLDDAIQEALNGLEKQPQFSSTATAISASYAPSIREEISELQRVLLEGLVAVLVVGSIVIAVRASIITVISMLTVIATAIGFLYCIGYTLNVITLFALILGLSLIVDDTIIMVEALDAARRREKTAREAVRQATSKISRAMVAATLTAALSFTPLAFVGGILGSFIRAIPVTIIASLLISLFVALAFIPLFARFILLGKKQMGSDNMKEIAAGVEARTAQLIVRPMLWARHNRRREVGVGLTAILISVGFIIAGGFIAKGVAFNIFPPSKDTNQAAVDLSFAPGTTIAQAQQIARQADTITAHVLGENLQQASYYGAANSQTATLTIQLTPYEKRNITAPHLVADLNRALKNFDGAKANAYTLDVGPPTSSFTINIAADNRQGAVRLANDMAQYLKGAKLTRPSGTQATITDATVSNTDTLTRTNGQPIVSVSASFSGTDTTTLVTLGQDLVKKHYNDAETAQFGLKASDISFDIGQESDNQNSFKTLALAFPAVLMVIYLLLAVQFRSLLQPLLIFMALPFSFFGIAAGLRLTNNPFSFFAMLGFFALIGLSIKNTILLTDYANQARRSNLGPVDAAVAALGERFRPLVATSVTAVVSLIPLAVTSPFWQGLAVVLIFGLLSSTFLVITIFPYYYLGGEFLRLHISRKKALLSLVLIAAILVILYLATKH